jgi:hypothetical protein
MDQNQNRDNDLFNFDNQPPRPAPDDPTVFAGSARVYETPPEQRPPAPPPYSAPPPPYNPPPPAGQPPAKSNRVWLIVVIVLVLLCCCCLAFTYFMWEWGGDWLIENMDISKTLPVFSALLA